MMWLKPSETPSAPPPPQPLAARDPPLLPIHKSASIPLTCRFRSGVLFRAEKVTPAPLPHLTFFESPPSPPSPFRPALYMRQLER